MCRGGFPWLLLGFDEFHSAKRTLVLSILRVRDPVIEATAVEDMFAGKSTDDVALYKTIEAERTNNSQTGQQGEYGPILKVFETLPRGLI